MRGKCGQHPDARCIRDCLKKKGEVMPERVKKEDFIKQSRMHRASGCCIRDCLKKKGEVMPERVKKEDFIRQLAVRMNADDVTAAAWIDGMVETLYESFKAGKGVTL